MEWRLVVRQKCKRSVAKNPEVTDEICNRVLKTSVSKCLTNTKVKVVVA